jgi:hypothetical protein
MNLKFIEGGKARYKVVKFGGVGVTYKEVVYSKGGGGATRVDGQYLKLQRDFTLGSGSEQRVRFRTLSKRTREQLLASANEHNNDMRNTAERALAHVKNHKHIYYDASKLHNKGRQQCRKRNQSMTRS